MHHAEEIHECFYDLFNLRFRVIEDESSHCHYYANVAKEGLIKPVPVHREFQCIVVLKQSMLNDTPAAFLNRFEKYLLSHKVIWDSLRPQFPFGIRNIFDFAIDQVKLIRIE